jgi:hypothetical protein
MVLTRICGLAFAPDIYNSVNHLLGRGMRQRIWLRHHATSRKVMASIPDVIGIFHYHNPSGWTGVNSGCNRNEYQEYFLVVKAAGAYS